MDVKGKNVFITGAAQGLGKAYAEALLEKGAKVFYGDINAETGAATLKLLQEKYGSDNVKFQPFDVTDKKCFEDAFTQAISSFGHIDVVVNNAGILNEGLWELCININFASLVFGTFLATEHMRKDKGGKGGRIINISSALGLDDHPNLPVYCGTKHAVRSFTSAMAMQTNIDELGVEYGILCPAAVDTELVTMLDHTKLKGASDEMKNYIINSAMPVQRVVAAMMELLTKEKMNGAILFIGANEKNYRKMVNTEIDETRNQ